MSVLDAATSVARATTIMGIGFAISGAQTPTDRVLDQPVGYLILSCGATLSAVAIGQVTGIALLANPYLMIAMATVPVAVFLLSKMKGITYTRNTMQIDIRLVFYHDISQLTIIGKGMDFLDAHYNKMMRSAIVLSNIALCYSGASIVGWAGASIAINAGTQAYLLANRSS